LKLPEHIGTDRLVMRRPMSEDAQAIFTGWASDARATRFVAWSRHESIDDTRAFLHFSDEQWERWPAGPYPITDAATGELFGSSGFGFRDPGLADIGYILRLDAWGHGYATECVRALMDCAASALGPLTLSASVHPDNRASLSVLRKCGFECDQRSGEHGAFPNLPGALSAQALTCRRVIG
jgi:[ribosomal protein S5]-alanine N-acetyltransferase